MADRYWVGGAGSWSDTGHWSTSDGGSSGSSAPTSSDNAFFTASSGAGSVNAAGFSACLNLDCTGYTGTITGSYLAVYGDLTLSSGGTYSGLTVKLTGTGSQACTFASKTLTNLYVEGDASNERTVTFNSAVTTSSTLFLNYGNGTTGGKAVTLKLKDGATTTIASLAMATGGPSSGRNTLQSTSSGTAATLSDSSGSNFFYYVNIADITASGGASWASGSTSYDYGGNSGITGLIGSNVNTLFFGDVA